MFDIRTISAEDADLFRRRVARGFGQDAETGEAAKSRFEAIFELDRTWAAFAGDDMIGTAAAFSLGITVPGGAEVPMGGTTVVTVQPTHRRRGVLRALMARHLDEVASRGEPLAGLWASEGSIYGRFGYGPATFRHTTEADTSGLAFSAEPPKGSARLVEGDEAAHLVPVLYERARGERHGMLTRSDAWWKHRIFADPESWREGKSALRHVVFEEDGAATGYVAYRQKGNWDDFIASGEIDLAELVTTSDAAHTGMWSFLTNVDLFTKLSFWNLPVDDPLPWKITEPRRLRRRLVDALWVRIMDVPAALEARAYEWDSALTFEVTDPAGTDVSGTYRLETSGGAATCRPVSDSADVSLGSDVLGHLYLGGGDALAMSAAGRIQGDPAAISALHRMFHTDRAPWCPEVF